MTKEEKELLLTDLCGRLHYGIKVQYNNEIYNIDYISALYEEVKLDIPDNYTVGISEIKPYLRPMSSMTEEEYKELKSISSYYGFAPYEYIGDWCPNYEMINWLNAHHFDFHNLIEKGLAIKASKGMYK